MGIIGLDIRINVDKIDKSHLVKGEKGTYLNLTAFIDPDEADQYGNNGMVTQGIDKEAREAGHKGAILGNGRVFWKKEVQAPQVPQQAFPNAGGEVQGDCPF